MNREKKIGSSNSARAGRCRGGSGRSCRLRGGDGPVNFAGCQGQRDFDLYDYLLVRSIFGTVRQQSDGNSGSDEDNHRPGTCNYDHNLLLSDVFRHTDIKHNAIFLFKCPADHFGHHDYNLDNTPAGVRVNGDEYSMLCDVCDDIHDDDRKFNEITRLMADLERSREHALAYRGL